MMRKEAPKHAAPHGETLLLAISDAGRMTSPPRILFYVEVFTELDRPQFHEAWIEFSARFMAGMMAAGHPATPETLRLLTNEALAELAPKHGFWDRLTAVVKERDFQDIFGVDYLTATVAGYKGETPEPVLDAAAACLRAALGDFEPDVIVTYTTAPWLRRAFPKAVILHEEYGLFSRPPYPESFYFDPNGKFANATIARHAPALRTMTADDAEATMVEKIRALFCKQIIPKVSPFAALEAAIRKRWKKIMLLPLQYCGHYGFEGTGKYRTQGEVVRDVMARIDPAIGVLVVNHSTAHYHGTIPPPDLYAYLGKHHENLLFSDGINLVMHASQYLLAHVDMVATVSSSVGLQAVLWDKPIVALGDSHINAIADYARPEDVPADAPTRSTWDKTGALAWLIRHYYIPAPYLRNKDWMSAFISRCMTRQTEGRLGLDFFDPIDTPDAIARAICDNADLKVPRYLRTPPSAQQSPAKG